MKQETKQRWLAALALVVWAPMAGELLTSSAPPRVFFVPWVFVLFACLYGLGALLIREAGVRLRFGWPAILLLGAAYGVLEEGLGAKSFFDPNWRALGPLGEHGRAYGVNWIWSLGLTGFHAFYSIALSILAVETCLPKARTQPWLPNWALAGVGILFSLDALLFYQKGNETFANTTQQSIGCVLLVVLLSGAALTLPRRNDAPSRESAVSWLRAFCHFFAAAAIFTALLYFFPSTGVPAWVTGGAVVALFAAIGVTVNRWTEGGGARLSRKTAFGVFAGVYAFFAVQAPLQEINPNRPDSASGMGIVGAAAAAGLWLIGRQVLRHRVEGELNQSPKEAHGY